jgi:hypothetical protein
MIDLHADGSTGERMFRISFDREHAAIFHPYKESASVGAIVGAN